MKVSMSGMVLETFIPMLESLIGWLEKGTAHAKHRDLDLVTARLAPDMYTLAQQVQQACHHAIDGVARLTGTMPASTVSEATSLAGLTAQIRTTLEQLRGVPAAAFDGAEARDCSVPTPNGMVIAMNGLEFLRAWALPHFYFHVVIAYGILRHRGVDLGKPDYLSQVGRFVRPPT